MSPKDDYIKELNKKLKRADAEIERLEQELKVKQVDAKITQSIRNNLYALNEFKDHASESLGELKHGFGNAYNELATALKRAGQKL